MKVYNNEGEKYEIPTDVDIVEVKNSVTGLTAIVYIYGNILCIKVYGPTLIALDLSNQYSRIGILAKIKELSTDSSSLIKRIYLTNAIYGQLVIDKSNGEIKIGYTRNVNGEPIIVDKNTSLYACETYVL